LRKKTNPKGLAAGVASLLLFKQQKKQLKVALLIASNKQKPYSKKHT
jgi:hypothetical protein